MISYFIDLPDPRDEYLDSLTQEVDCDNDCEYITGWQKYCTKNSSYYDDNSKGWPWDVCEKCSGTGKITIRNLNK